ncbi:hypothetical protein [Pseudomarimonas arenosa]|uniref:Flagellar protein FliT n=1 Tax=Pseudomarimonas arenosa TaxID=2774145 RepID=A0AAW3ZF25_9GAMM|nr:hypothetical protein [Pseudomarimonas arenosa]MBD8524748.1 hypothetical protein [Pseudomarimonas arenosa]
MPELQQLIDQLDRLQACCEEQRWEDAHALMDEHAATLHAMPVEQLATPPFVALLQRARDLMQHLLAMQDEARRELEAFSAKSRSVESYKKHH